MKKYLFILPLFSFHCFGVTFGQWQKYTKDQKINYLNETSNDVEICLPAGKMTQTTLTSPRLEIIKKKIPDLHKKLMAFEPNFDTEVQDDMYAVVGGLKTKASLYFSEDNHLLGAEVRYTQAGCSHMDEEGEYVEGGGYYRTVNEAESNNCFDNDVSWTAYSIIDHLFVELQNSDYMEWTGH